MSQPLPVCPAPDAHPVPPAFDVPAGAADCHAHIFEPFERYPLQGERGYTPAPAPLADLLDLERRLGVERLVLVQASAHGTDNRAILDAASRHPQRLRAVVSVGEEVSERDLETMHEKGARGIRVNLVDRGGMPFSSLAALAKVAERIKHLGWHVELLVQVESAPELESLVRSMPVPVSVGHIGYCRTAEGLDHPGYRRFLELLRDGLFWVKLTGPYRISAEERLPYSDVAPFARAVVEAAPGRVVWGSDWPHVLHWGEMPNDGGLFNLLSDWVPDEQARKRILVDNPARLYGFG
ncbi:amidohydrolase family protein [Propylenella binzhouense]|uniref:GntR family transcriptional regulator n=1 Tax=Propylenella binzhouense TaxID=2555902 RepID=A0A964T467_9HYPH|nr:amidohydrolase family protein [Propylenella binzhouense]MYZ47594.1 GntR family transcriptional regulator [Propylenella binzhouense]